MTPEQLIYELQKQIIALEKELAQAQEDIKDFEVLALIWKKSYLEMESRYKIKLGNAEQVIEQLEKDLSDSKSIE